LKVSWLIDYIISGGRRKCWRPARLSPGYVKPCLGNSATNLFRSQQQGWKEFRNSSGLKIHHSISFLLPTSVHRIDLAMALDPLTALSLAGTIVQFVDFGSKLVSRSKELYGSANGSLSVNEELDLVTQTLLKLVAKLQRPHESDVLAESGADDYQSLVELCSSCAQVAGEIITKLENLKMTGKPRRLRSLQQAVKSCWTERDLDALFKRLSMLRQALETQIIVRLRCVRSESQLTPSILLTNAIYFQGKPRAPSFAIMWPF